MKPVVFAILVGILIGGNLLAFVPQDAPHPDAVAFCSMNSKTEGGKCTCTDMEVGGAACQLNENGRPRICKWMCGHAKSCGCCVS